MVIQRHGCDMRQTLARSAGRAAVARHGGSVRAPGPGLRRSQWPVRGRPPASPRRGEQVERRGHGDAWEITGLAGCLRADKVLEAPHDVTRDGPLRSGHGPPSVLSALDCLPRQRLLPQHEGPQCAHHAGSARFVVLWPPHRRACGSTRSRPERRTSGALSTRTSPPLRVSQPLDTPTRRCALRIFAPSSSSPHGSGTRSWRARSERTGRATSPGTCGGETIGTGPSRHG